MTYLKPFGLWQKTESLGSPIQAILPRPVEGDPWERGLGYSVQARKNTKKLWASGNRMPEVPNNKRLSFNKAPSNGGVGPSGRKHPSILAHKPTSQGPARNGLADRKRRGRVL